MPASTYEARALRSSRSRNRRRLGLSAELRPAVAPGMSDGMRLVVLGGLVVAALGVVLLFVIRREIQPEPVHPQGPAATPTPASPSAPSPAVATATATVAPRREPGAPHHSAMPIAPAMPAAPELAPARPKHVDTPTDLMRWSLMRAIRTTEPAVIDCLDKAKQAGVAVDGTSVYSFFVAKKGDQIVFDGSTFESGPYPASLNKCIQDVTNNAVVDSIPDGTKRVQALRRLVVEHGEITAYKLASYHIDPPPATTGP